MRILLLTHAFNSLTQRLYVELAARGHEISVEFDINDRVAIEAVAMFRPEVVIAPYLKRAIPDAIWRNHTCLIVHPGPPGDRGPASLDRAIMEGRDRWGVSVIQAIAEMDAGPIWASASFPMRDASKSSLYRFEVTRAAVTCILEAVDNLQAPGFAPSPQAPGPLLPMLSMDERRIDWQGETTQQILRKIHAADGSPGAADVIEGQAIRLFDAHAEGELKGRPGDLLAFHDGAVCRASRDGAVWIGHMREEGSGNLKLPSTMVLKKEVTSDLPEIAPDNWRRISTERRDGVAILRFDFHNGAMGTDQCRALEAAFIEAKSGREKVVLLAGGENFWCNGIHLGLIEAAESPADESMANIEAMDDLCRTIIEATDTWTIAAIRGNAGAGGVFMALAADQVLAAEGAVLNPHYRNMGNLFGSEYWTYLLPRRIGNDAARLMENRLPLGAAQAAAMGLIDGTFQSLDEAVERAASLAASPELARMLADKRRRRMEDERNKPLSRHREEELERMRLNFYGFDPSYHVARYNFMYRVPHSRTPLYLARHRRLLSA